MLVYLIFALGLGANAQLQFRVIKEWHYANFTWPNEEALSVATASGEYNPNKVIMSGLGYYNGFYYVTTPRMYIGAPATLSRIPETGSNGPLLEPFPSWKKNKIGDCEALQNVQNIQIDAEGNLYVIDSGRSNTMGGHQRNNLCSAKIVKYDLNKKDGENMAKEVFRYEFPDNVASKNVNFLYDLVLDISYVYISDNSATDPGLIVFSEHEMKSWKIRHGTFKADQNATFLNVSGTVLQPELNLAGLALGPPMTDGRLLYYSPLSSYVLFGVNTNDLKNPSTTTLKDVRLVGRKSSQSDGMIMDDKGVLYFGQLGTSSVSMWDTTKPGFKPKLIAQDPNYVQWPNSFTFNADGDLVVLCNTLAKFITHHVDLAEPNFRLLAGNVKAQSYVRNVAKYDEGGNSGHVHFHPMSSNGTQGVLATESFMGAGDVNDLLIYDENDYQHKAPRSGANSYGGSIFVICLFFWLAREC